MNSETYTYPDGTTYTGEWEDNKRHGYGIWTRPDGMQYEGEWENDKPHGRGILINPDGSKFSGDWKEGKRDGRGMLTYPDGTKKVGVWKTGKFAGEKEPLVGRPSESGSVDDCRDLQEENRELQEKLGKLEGRKRQKKPREKKPREKKAHGISFPYLKKFNFVMGFLHLAQGALMLFFALTIDQISEFRTPIRSYFLQFDTASMRLVTNPDQLGEVPFALFVSFFLLLSALAHFIIVMPGANEIYNRDLKKGINKFRWYEYSLSSSLMIILIAMLFGVYDIGALVAIFILNASMNWFGLLMEEINQYTERTSWSAFVFGCIAGIGPWVVIIMHALGNADPAEVPWFVYAIIGSYFVFFNLFPINMILQYKQVGKWADYLYGERGYIILSLVAKSVLAWLVFFGVMQPT